MNFEVGARTDRGKLRSNNEDSLYAGPALGSRGVAERGLLLAVADGVGGQAAGEVASVIAIRRLAESYYTSSWTDPAMGLREAVRDANRAVLDEARRTDRMGMASTIVAAVIFDASAFIAHVGDSRAYLIRGEKATQLTRDHSPVAELVATGALSEADAANHPHRHFLSRTLGLKDEVESDLVVVPLGSEDTLLLCSDGLSSQVPPDELRRAAREESAQAMADYLVAAANAAGGRDNVTAVIAQRVVVGARNATPRGPGGVITGRKTILAALVAGLAILALLALALSAGSRSRSVGPAAKTPALVASNTIEAQEKSVVAEMTTQAITETAAIVDRQVVERQGKCPPGMVPATLKDPGESDKNPVSYIYPKPDQQSAKPGDEIALNREVALCVLEEPGFGGSTGYKPHGAARTSAQWYQATFGEKRGWVACPLVFFTDTNEWAKCEDQ